MTQFEDHDLEEKEEWKTISLKKYVSPEEKHLRKQNKKLKKLMWLLAIVFLLAGWIGGSVLPFGYTAMLRSRMSSRSIAGSDKISAAIDLMKSEWYFAKDIEDVETRLIDQAVTGVTTNEEDPHTEYMSAQETMAFTQSINRNYVGIGVQFTLNDGYALIEKVFLDSPAEKAGIQSGDVITAVDGTDINGLSTTEIKELVQGEEGTEVAITVTRDSRSLTLKVTRAQLAVTTYGEILDNQTGYLQLYQFGETTPAETKAYLEDFTKNGVTKLVIDLRDNGGGYLTSVQEIAGYFLPEDSVVLRQEFSDGSAAETKVNSKPFEEIKQIVLLVNENTASASEVLTLALSEQLDHVTVVGRKTYGKGTAQITRSFSDGSSIKYTTSKWLSPNGTWVNGEGITPDVEVNLHDIFYTKFSGMEQGETVAADTVSDNVKIFQQCLDYLGYDVGRTDGYFCQQTLQAMQQFEADRSLETTEELTVEVYNTAYSNVILDWNSSRQHDTQYAKALEILNG